MKKILIVDDHHIVRKGLKHTLTDEFGEVEFGEAVNGIEALQKIREKKWDIIILDINMPGRNGLEVLRQVKDEKICASILVLSMHPEEQVAIRALKLGASGYLAKDSADTELISAIRQIGSGKKYITPSLAQQLAAHIENPLDKAPHELLSDREYATLLFFAKGKTVSQIARELSLAATTISSFRVRILHKMRMKTNAELVNYAIRNNLV